MNFMHTLHCLYFRAALHITIKIAFVALVGANEFAPTALLSPREEGLILNKKLLP
ncbi:MAG: hypothetical protein HHJ09_13485 [Glaciimonas sp.]|nr:hypothetical protein [Glaciimonas sp.]